MCVDLILIWIFFLFFFFFLALFVLKNYLSYVSLILRSLENIDKENFNNLLNLKLKLSNIGKKDTAQSLEQTNKQAQGQIINERNLNANWNDKRTLFSTDDHFHRNQFNLI